MTVRIDELFEKLPAVLSVKDLTEILGKDRTTVYRWLKKGEVPGVLIDTTWIIYRDEVRDYLLSRHNQNGALPLDESDDLRIKFGLVWNQKPLRSTRLSLPLSGAAFLCVSCALAGAPLRGHRPISCRRCTCAAAASVPARWHPQRGL
jgi:excisionase family DNA binding protein